MRRTVLIVDDHEAFRESAAALLEAEGFDVVGQAADGPEAVARGRAAAARGRAPRHPAARRSTGSPSRSAWPRCPRHRASC